MHRHLSLTKGEEERGTVTYIQVLMDAMFCPIPLPHKGVSWEICVGTG